MSFDQPSIVKPVPLPELPKEINIDITDEKEYLAEPEKLIDLNNPFPPAPPHKDSPVL